MNNIRNRAMEIVNNELIYAREPAARISTSETFGAAQSVLEILRFVPRKSDLVE